MIHMKSKAAMDYHMSSSFTGLQQHTRKHWNICFSNIFSLLITIFFTVIILVKLHWMKINLFSISFQPYNKCNADSYSEPIVQKLATDFNKLRESCFHCSDQNCMSMQPAVMLRDGQTCLLWLQV